ncbi:hypothetical protein [Parachlamydia sp. AcF125]|uniref:hypothetical protein n=1 Tax=Parachlamydia sp. AcF125 TaxID=2795736 RepID=UPI001BC930CC|nr:hypothetical protein [Parachlamydia sp. AcF125]MBS4168414.1 hypothetical protein [Parachlamydia sp. AcF125]
MTLKDIQFIFNRALSLSFCKKKWLLTFCVLALCGILVVFFRGLALKANQWVVMSLTFLPIFLSAGIMLSLGIFLARIYHHEIKRKEVNYRDILNKSWEVVIGATYFCVPIILSYLLLWIVMGIFMLLNDIPGLGDFFGVVLSFAPFLLNFGSLILCLFSLSLLFFMTPLLALRGLNRLEISQILIKRVKEDIFSNLLLALVALFPLMSIVGLLVLSAVLTGSLCDYCDTPTYTILQWFFIMIPFTAILAPAIIFFFNFSTEAHVLLQKELKGEAA